MNVTPRRFANKTRTWLLIAALIALLIGIGALIGGIFLYPFVALAVVLNVFALDGDLAPRDARTLLEVRTR